MRERARRSQMIRAVVAAVIVPAMVLAPSVGAQPPGSVCGGTPDCSEDPSPPFGGLPPASTEIEPAGNYLVVQNPLGPGNPELCFEASGPIAGVSVIDLDDIQEAQLFTQAPSIDVVSTGRVLPFPLSGSELQCGGVVCLPGVGEAVAVTDAAIGTVFGSELREHPLPAGAAPVSAAGIGTCLDGDHTFTLCVETTAPSIQCVFVGQS